MAKRKPKEQLQWFRVSRTSTKHIDVQAADEDWAQEQAFDIPESDWIDEGGDTEVEKIAGEE